MIILKSEHYKAIAEYARDGLPKEVCGLMGGLKNRDVKTVKKLYFAENTANSHRRFRIDNGFQLSAIKDMRKNGYILLGNFHSHPNGRLVPSREDEDYMHDGVSYIIAAVTKKIELKAFCIDNGVLKEEKLVII